MNLPNDHIVKSYDEEQQRRVAEIVRMGEMAVAQLEASMDVIEKRDENAAHRIIANDEAIDALEQQISHDVMRLALLLFVVAFDDVVVGKVHVLQSR